MNQPTLPNLNRANHAHLGREFERLLEASHEEYKVRKLAIIEKNPIEWKYCGRSDYDYLSQNRSADLTAKTNTGRFIKRAQSDVDYSGTLKGGRSINFDAKQTGGKSFPLSNVEKHQIRNLREKAEMGAISGLMIYFTELERIFFVSAQAVAKIYDAIITGGRKSLSIEYCEGEGVEIPKRGNQIDWLKVLNK
jgi:recombination protein U